MALQFVEVEFTQPGKPAAGTPKDADGNYVLPKYKCRQIADSSVFETKDPAKLMAELISVVGAGNYEELAESFKAGWNTRERWRGAGMLLDPWTKSARDPKIRALFAAQVKDLTPEAAEQKIISILKAAAGVTA